MCRFVMYLGEPITLASLVTDPANSLIRQSVHARERFEPLNGDGFGVAWYAPEIDRRPALFKSVTPAWNNRNLLNLARVTKSGAIIAHVRAATSSQSVDEVNCHPFTWRHVAFAHNGDVGGFQKIRRGLLGRLSDEAFSVIHGSTDSEHAFALFVDHLLRSTVQDSADALAQALTATIHELTTLALEADPKAHCYLNFVVTDGANGVVSHVSTDRSYIDSLHVHAGSDYRCEKGTTRILARRPTSTRSVIVASEALSNDPAWHTMGVNRLLVVRGDRTADTRELTISQH